MCQCSSAYHPAQTYYNPARKRARGLGTTGVQTAISAGGAGAGLLIGAAVGGPIGAAIGGAISVTASAISSLFTPDYYKIYASNDANEIASLMQENLNGWNSLPASSKVPAVQQYFEQNYLTLWNSLVSYCSNPQLGTAGQKCISDRSPNGPYPWVDYYLNPIQNYSPIYQQTTAVTFQDPLSGIKVTVQPSTPVASATSTIDSTLGIQLTTEDWLAIGAGLVLLGIFA